jgi:hypothetical protein
MSKSYAEVQSVPAVFVAQNHASRSDMSLSALFSRFLLCNTQICPVRCRAQGVQYTKLVACPLPLSRRFRTRIRIHSIAH